MLKHWVKSRNVEMRINDLLEFIKNEVKQWGLDSNLTDDLFSEFESINKKTDSKHQIKKMI